MSQFRFPQHWQDSRHRQGKPASHASLTLKLWLVFAGIHLWWLSATRKTVAFCFFCFSTVWAHGILCLSHLSGSTGSWNMGTDESPSVTDDAADEIMDRIVKSATQVPSQRVVPRERKRSRANRKSCECMLIRPGKSETQRKLPLVSSGYWECLSAFFSNRKFLSVSAINEGGGAAALVKCTCCTCSSLYQWIPCL